MFKKFFEISTIRARGMYWFIRFALWTPRRSVERRAAWGLLSGTVYTTNKKFEWVVRKIQEMESIGVSLKE